MKFRKKPVVIEAEQWQPNAKKAPNIFAATYEPVDAAGAKEISAKRGLSGPQDDCG